MKYKFLTALFLFAVALTLLSDLSYVHSVIKIPIRIATLLIMLAPIYFVMKKEVSFKEILFQQQFTRKTFYEVAIISLGLIVFASIIRFFSYDNSFITFGNSLHYKEYLPLYVTFGYFVEVLLQDTIFILIYVGLSKFVTTQQKSFWSVAIVFGFAHIYFGFFTALLTFLTAIVFLLIYQRYQNLLALGFIHYSAGVASIAFGWT